MASRGCLTCRRRKVKCDEGRPSCKRCVKRGEACVGYRDDLDLMFRDENANAARRANTARRRMSLEHFQQDFECFPKYTESRQVPKSVATAVPYVVDFNHSSPYSWTTNSSVSDPHAEDHAVSKFFESYVMYPCNQSSSPGFLEHLPSLFREFDVEGRYALRWAVQAAAYADSANGPLNTEVPEKALRCYGLALNALAAALSDPKQAPDDYTLMTVVVLDLFESLYLPDPLTRGAHAGGMAQILRLRGPDQIHGARGWSLFRLSHHRLQKQQLAFGKPPLPESDIWLRSLNDEKPDSQIEKSNHEISKVCHHARDLLQQINDDKAGPEETFKLIGKMHSVDRIATTWRGGPEWSFKTLNRRDIRGPLGQVDFPEHIQIHQDVWIAYEWNYHRTARIILHQNLLNCLTRLEDLTAPNDLELLLSIAELKELSLAIIQTLVAEILSTIPQSLGDIDHNGTYLAEGQQPRIGRGVGAYFLLWPIKIIKHLDLAHPQQVEMAKRCFERIRECTGMKEQLGDLSCI